MIVDTEEQCEELSVGHKVFLAREGRPVGPGLYIISHIVDLLGYQIEVVALEDRELTLTLGFDAKGGVWHALFPDPLGSSLVFSTRTPPIDMER